LSPGNEIWQEACTELVLRNQGSPRQLILFFHPL
jgi:hypothetical protein